MGNLLDCKKYGINGCTHPQPQSTQLPKAESKDVSPSSKSNENEHTPDLCGDAIVELSNSQFVQIRNDWSSSPVLQAKSPKCRHRISSNLMTIDLDDVGVDDCDLHLP